MLLRNLKKVKNIFLKKGKKRIRHILNVKQENRQIQISGFLNNENYEVKQLWLISRFSDHEYHIDSEEQSNQFKFNIDLTEKCQLLTIDQDIYDLFLFVQVTKENFSEKKIVKLEETSDVYIDENGNTFFQYPIRLGRYENTELINLKPIKVNDQQYYIYNTVKGNLSLAVNYEIQPNTTVQIDYLKSKPHHIKFGGKLFTKSSLIDSIELVIVGRETNVETHMSVKLKYMSDAVKKRFGLNRYKYETTVDLNKVFENPIFNADIYDFYFDIKYHDFPELVRVRIGKPRFKARYNLRQSSAEREEEVFSASPYYTFKKFNLSIQIDNFEKETFVYLRRMMRWSWLLRLFSKKQDIWVVGERSYKAQDTGFHFFKYMRENHPEKNVFYIIEENSPELDNVLPYGNVLFYKSKEHIKHVLMATRVIGSHHPDYLYPLRTKEFNKKVKAKKVFLQHGVMGTKNMVANYGKSALSFSTDIFMVSSLFEKEMIVNDFGYDPQDVFITGLSRFDNLLKDDIETKKQVLIIPTWRDWLITDDKFLESEYFERYSNLIHDPRLHELAQQYDFSIVFCLHPNMQKFTTYFENSPVKVISQGEVDVQSLLKSSALMITDYSSVAFDFSFLSKPIVYYQFDRKRFIGKRGSHLDLDNDLPGDIVYDLDEIINLTEKYAQSEFKMKEENRAKASKFLKYKDQNSSERIYQAISKKIKKKPAYKSFLNSELSRTLFNRFRKSKRYFPTMKLFYKIAMRILPVDDRLIVFESGIGKQYADSPRNIYEEIIRKELNYKKVWICNQNVRFNDPNTIRIRRLSPSYYYYLAKAKYWVNNQNFPTYIEKRPETTYIQTWHGTPLKKMLHDIENIMGRSEDYLERVDKATKTWDYLVSPSKYASEAFKSAFRYKKEIIETGYPRNDIFYKEERFEITRKVRNRLHIPEGKKIILYAPTFRDNQTSAKNKFLFELPMDLYQLKERLGDEYIILLRMHVVVSNKIKVDEELQDFVMNVSSYSDIQELLLITDILITDYSSVMFDFANTKRPMLFYTYDFETYRDDVRGFYMDFEKEAPGPLMRNTEEIIDNVVNITGITKEYSARYEQFYEKYCSLEDGKASERIVNMHFDEQGKN